MYNCSNDTTLNGRTSSASRAWYVCFPTLIMHACMARWGTTNCSGMHVMTCVLVLCLVDASADIANNANCGFNGIGVVWCQVVGARKPALNSYQPSRYYPLRMGICWSSPRHEESSAQLHCLPIRLQPLHWHIVHGGLIIEQFLVVVTNLCSAAGFTHQMKRWEQKNGKPHLWCHHTLIAPMCLENLYLWTCCIPSTWHVPLPLHHLWGIGTAHIIYPNQLSRAVVLCSHCPQGHPIPSTSQQSLRRGLHYAWMMQSNQEQTTSD